MADGTVLELIRAQCARYPQKEAVKWVRVEGGGKGGQPPVSKPPVLLDLLQQRRGRAGAFTYGDLWAVASHVAAQLQRQVLRKPTQETEETSVGGAAADHHKHHQPRQPPPPRIGVMISVRWTEPRVPSSVFCFFLCHQ